MNVDANSLDALVTAMLTPQRHERPGSEDPPWTEHGTLATANGSIAYWRAGSGPPVMLVHGWEGTHDDLAEFVRPLARCGRSVIAPDLYAHGASSGTTASIFDLADAVRAVGNHAGPLEGVIAHSIGCAATGHALAGGLAAKRVVLISSPVRYAGYVKGHAEHAGIPLETLIAAFGARGIDVTELDLARVAAGLDVPALIVHSNDDRVTPVAGAVLVSAAWRNSTFRRVDGLGHRRILRDPATVEAAVAFALGGP